MQIKSWDDHIKSLQQPSCGTHQLDPSLIGLHMTNFLAGAQDEIIKDEKPDDVFSPKQLYPWVGEYLINIMYMYLS